MSENEEWAGVNRLPRIPVVIAGFNYPKPVKAAIKKVDEAWSAWAEADTAVAVAEDELEQAKALDGRLFAESVLTGKDDPGEIHTPPALRRLKGAQILADARRLETNAVGRILDSLLSENAREITLTAIEAARAGIAEQERLMTLAAEYTVEASKVRNSGLEGLRFISQYTRGTYAFDPSFPVVGQVSFPNVREERIRKIADDLESLIEKGNLFPVAGDDDPVIFEATA